jgi:hypothetical protein
MKIKIASDDDSEGEEINVSSSVVNSDKKRVFEDEVGKR